MIVSFEWPDQPRREPVTAELPIPPREGDWVSVGDEDDQYVVRTVIWHTHAEDANAPTAQVILKG